MYGAVMQGDARRCLTFHRRNNMSEATIKVRIEGVTPILMHRFTEESEVKVSSGISAIAIGDKGTPREQAAKKLYKDEKGNLFLPGPNIFACIIAAGKFHKNGKSKVTTMRSSLVPAAMSILDLICPFGTKTFEVDSRSVVIPATGGRIMAHRPRLDKWALTFRLLIETDMFTEDFARKLVDDAGKKIGLGDFRPDRKGPFGKFVVSNWAKEVNHAS